LPAGVFNYAQFGYVTVNVVNGMVADTVSTFQVPSDGYYVASANIYFDGGLGATTRAIRFTVPGSYYVAQWQEYFPSGESIWQQITWCGRLTSGQRIGPEAFSNVGETIGGAGTGPDFRRGWFSIFGLST
jgi:hypothetical protein